MNILAFDTVSDLCSASLLTDQGIISRSSQAPRAHAELILGYFDELLDEAGFHLSKIDVVGFGRGPGAFTGVRIGTSVCQAIAFAHDLPVAAISSLAAMALAAPDTHENSLILSAFDARMGEVYWSGYHKTSKQSVSLAIAEEVNKPELVPLLNKKHIIAVGSAFKTYQSLFETRLATTQLHIEAELCPHANEVALLAQHEARQGTLVAADQALPVYLRNRIVR